MNIDVLSLYSCRASRKGLETDAPEARETQDKLCGGQLMQRDALTLVCKRCGREYPVRAGIPQLANIELNTGKYAKDARLQDYAEMHYAPYLSGPKLRERLCFPQPRDADSPPEDIPAENFTEARKAREAKSKHARSFFKSVDFLAKDQCLTEEFYEYMLDLSRPFIVENTLALDVGCGFGRMTLELAKMGAQWVIGLDSSQHMVEAASRFATSTAAIPVRLNLTAGRTIAAKVRVPGPVNNCSFVIGDAQQLAFQDQTFDLALCLNVIDRVPQPRQVIDELWRVLKPGGQLIISDPYDWEHSISDQENWVSDMSELFDEQTWEQKREIDGIPFAMRSGSNRYISIYLNHCFQYEKVGRAA